MREGDGVGEGRAGHAERGRPVASAASKQNGQNEPKRGEKGQKGGRGQSGRSRSRVLRLILVKRGARSND